jgi:hypothetical protein
MTPKAPFITAVGSAAPAVDVLVVEVPADLEGETETCELLPETAAEEEDDGDDDEEPAPSSSPPLAEEEEGEAESSCVCVCVTVSTAAEEVSVVTGGEVIVANDAESVPDSAEAEAEAEAAAVLTTVVASPKPGRKLGEYVAVPS